MESEVFLAKDGLFLVACQLQLLLCVQIVCTRSTFSRSFVVGQNAFKVHFGSFSTQNVNKVISLQLRNNYWKAKIDEL